MAFLSPGELRKYDWRAEVFVNKLKTGTPFQTKNGNITLTFNQQTVDIIMDGTLSELRALRIDGFKLSDIVKCSEFGGKSDNGTVKEQFALNRLNEQLTTIKQHLNKPYISIRHNDNVYEVTKAEDTPGTPKSDFHLVTGDGEEVFWISHKDGKSPKCFQQWGGVSAKTESKINSHPETQTFISQVKASYPQGIPRATTVAKKIHDDTLKHLSVYGNEFGSNESRQNVSTVIQGNVHVEPSKGEYRITGDICHYNGQLISGAYEPIFVATMRSDRSNEGIPNTRLSITPIEGRKITTWF